MRRWEELDEREKLDVVLSIVNVIASIIMIVGGTYLIFDDSGDIGKFDHGGEFINRLPWPINILREKTHHWEWGIVLILLGILVGVIAFLRISAIFFPQVRDKLTDFVRTLEERFQR